MEINMYYKLINDYELLSSSSTKVTPDGRPVSNFTVWLDSKSPEYRIAMGWYELITDQPPESTEENAGKTYRLKYQLSANNVVLGTWEEYVVEEPSFNMLKTSLRKNMTEAGLGEVLDGYLASNAEAKRMWDECLVLESNSPFVVNAVQAIVGMGLKTDAELKEILEKSRTNLVV